VGRAASGRRGDGSDAGLAQAVGLLAVGGADAADDAEVAGAIAAFGFNAPIRGELIAQANEAGPVVLDGPVPVGRQGRGVVARAGAGAGLAAAADGVDAFRQ